MYYGYKNVNSKIEHVSDTNLGRISQCFILAINNLNFLLHLEQTKMHTKAHEKDKSHDLRVERCLS